MNSLKIVFRLTEKTKRRKSIFHVAAEKRHESIFYLLNEIGTIGDIIIDSNTENMSNILHLAAELAPKEKLNAISGAALQMQREMLWFKEVEKIVPPVFKKMKNGNMETPLLIGIASLCISIAAMMVAFFTSFMLTNHNGKELPVFFAVIGLFAIAPIIYGVLKWYLFIDIARSTFFRFKPRQRLLSKEVSHEPASPAIESAPTV
nr:hypothetical protein CFP56_46526 [Quercus suber]